MWNEFQHEFQIRGAEALRMPGQSRCGSTSEHLASEPRPLAVQGRGRGQPGVGHRARAFSHSGPHTWTTDQPAGSNYSCAKKINPLDGQAQTPTEKMKIIFLPPSVNFCADPMEGLWQETAEPGNKGPITPILTEAVR